MKKSSPTTNASPWPVKGVDRDTREALKMAAKREKKPLGQFFNTTLREYAQSLVQSKPRPPVQIERVSNDVEQLKEQMATVLQKLEDQPEKPSLWGGLFANKKKK